MINITYDIWLEACELIKEYSKTYGKFYLQTYPLYLSMKYKEIGIISCATICFFSSLIGINSK